MRDRPVCSDSDYNQDVGAPPVTRITLRSAFSEDLELLDARIAVRAPGFRLGACLRIGAGGVASAAGTDARRRDAVDAGVHRRGATTPQMPPRRRNPEGAW